MIPVTDNGRMDIERINNLPIEEYINVLSHFTNEQYQEYSSMIPHNAGLGQQTTPIAVDYTLEEALDKAWVVDAESLLKQLRDKYGLDFSRGNTDEMD